MDWPAGQIDRMSSALNTYTAMSSYVTASGDKAKWLDNNPQIARTVLRVIKWRMGK